MRSAINPCAAIFFSPSPSDISPARKPGGPLRLRSGISSCPARCGRWRRLPVWPPLEIRSPQGWPLNNPREPYWGHYQGDEDTQRKPAYHNGTAWPWVLPTGVRSAGQGLGCGARRSCGRQSLPGQHGILNVVRLPRPVAGNSRRRRPAPAARLRRPSLERSGSAASLEAVWEWLNLLRFCFSPMHLCTKNRVDLASGKKWAGLATTERKRTQKKLTM